VASSVGLSLFALDSGLSALPGLTGKALPDCLRSARFVTGELASLLTESLEGAQAHCFGGAVGLQIATEATRGSE
jgi:hypothetical protein